MVLAFALAAANGSPGQNLEQAGFDAFDVWIGGASEESVERWRAQGHRLGLEVGVETGADKVQDLGPAIATRKRP